MKSAVILFPGTNRERDMAAALKRATGREPADRLARRDDAPDVDLIVLPGGFSFGDYLRSGAIAARSPVMPEVVKRAARRRARARRLQRLPDALRGGAPARRPDAQRLAEVRLPRGEARSGRTPRRRSPAPTAPRQVIRCPVAHADGNYFADDGDARPAGRSRAASSSAMPRAPIRTARAATSPES